MKFALAQINPTVGDFAGNLAQLSRSVDRAVEAGADLLLFSELVVTGYPPKDLLEKRDFVARNLAAVDQLAAASGRVPMLVGHVARVADRSGRGLRNAASFLAGGRIVATAHKILLPTYDVFDEARYFDPGERATRVELGQCRIGITICEDIWNDESSDRPPLYSRDPVRELSEQGIDLLVNLSASPFCRGRPASRLEMLAEIARRWRVPVVHVNQVGGNDDLIFDGTSALIDAEGRLVEILSPFVEGFAVAQLGAGAPAAPASIPEEIELLCGALVLGLRDYARKCGFSDVVIGLSGGIDSSVVAALAAQALGPEHVWGVAMPSRFSSEHSLADARALAANLGVHFEIVPITGLFDQYRLLLDPVFAGRPPDITEENIQARIRGNILMALSNKFGRLVLTTGNKSELAVGYCTLYGDMSGGLAVISDLLKTDVYRLARFLNRHREVIPESVLTKPPSAELRPDQKDSDSLPPYDVLDPILAGYVEERRSPAELVSAGHDAATVRRVVELVDRNEYKRKQAAPGLRITAKAFGSGWRMPIAQRYRAC